nr:Major facilitator superfamily general substrate transporter [Hymenolepis microstoma]
MTFNVLSHIKSLGNIQSQKLSGYAFASFIITFLVLGLSISISGPSVMFLEEIAYTWEDEVALIFTSRAVGSIGGWLTSYVILKDTHKYCGALFGYGLFGLIIANFSVAFTDHLWWLLAAFSFQGAFIVAVAQGCLSYVRKHSLSCNHIQQFLVFISLLGCALAPVLFIPLSSTSNMNNATVFMSVGNGTISKNGPPVIQTISRSPRSLVGVESPPGNNTNLPPSFAVDRLTLNTSMDTDLTTIKPSSTLTTNASMISSTIAEILPSSSYNQSLSVYFTTPAPSHVVLANSDEHINATEEINTSKSPFSDTISTIFSTFLPSEYLTTVPPDLNYDAKVRTESISNDTEATKSPEYISNMTDFTVSPEEAPNGTATEALLGDNLNASTLEVAANASEGLGKPDIVDAEHLNQDSNSADGSNTVVKMKLADEDVRIAEQQARAAQLAEKESHLKAKSQVTTTEVNVDPETQTTAADDTTKPSLVDATHLSQDKNTADGSNPADIMKHLTDEINDEDSEIPPIIIITIPSSTETGEDEVQNSGDSHIVTEPLSQTTTSLPSTLINASVAIPTSQTAPPFSTPITAEVKPRSNDTYRLTSTYNSKWDTRTPRRWQDESTRLQYMKAVRYVYLSVGLFTVLSWFILLPLTGVFTCVRPFLECFSVQKSFNSLNQQADSTNLDNGIVRTDTDEVLQTSSPTNPESPPPQVVTKNVSWCAEGVERTAIVKSDLHASISVPNFAVLRSSRHSPTKTQHENAQLIHLETQKETSETPEQLVYLKYAPRPTVWPLVTCPADFWVLAATFIFAGLETTYGAFIHSFTLGTLHWSPVNALLVTMLFWIGDAIGRLCYLCLGETADMGINLLQNSVDLALKDSTPPEAAPFFPISRRREKSFHIAALFIRTIGSLICLICTTILKEMTTSHLVYLAPADNNSRVIYESWSIARDKVTWASTVGLGIGLGAIAGSGLHVHQPRGYILYLAMLLGQSIVPASAGYLTERVFHKNASQTLGRTTMILSILLFLFLLADLFLQLVRRFVWWEKVTQWLSPFPKTFNHKNSQKELNSSTLRSNSAGPISNEEIRPKVQLIQSPSSPSDIPLETRSVGSVP